jgi:hypothetical protein
MAQTFIQGLKPEIKTEMLKTTFNRAEQKAQIVTKINETSADYMGTTANKENQGAQRGRLEKLR